MLDSGHKVVSGGGAPGLAFDYGTMTAITGNPIVTITEGKPPVGVHEIALDQQTADKAGYQVGDQVTLVTPGPKPQMTVTLSGIVHFGQTATRAVPRSPSSASRRSSSSSSTAGTSTRGSISRRSRASPSRSSQQPPRSCCRPA